MAEIKSLSDSRIQVSGELDFNTVVDLKARGETAIAAAVEPVEIDLAGVTRAGSGAVSLLLSWLRFASERKQAIRFFNMPDDLMGVAHVSGVDNILPIDGFSANP